jgi:hypothetical protein
MATRSERRILGASIAVSTLAAALLCGYGATDASAQQLLTGGNSGSGAGTRYTAPGVGNIYGADFPATGLGESAAQIRMPAGTLKKMKVTLVPDGAQTSGQLTVTVRVNGSDSALACSVDFEGGECKIPESVTLVSDDRIAIQVSSTLDTGSWAFTYSVKFE